MQLLNRNFWNGVIGLVLASLVAVSLATPAAADSDVDHPIKVLKARYQSNGGGGLGSSKGTMTIWLKNLVGVTVDGIEIEVELYNDRRRKVETLKKKIGELGAGEKKVVTFTWDVLAEKIEKPRFFIEYNARGNQKSRFEGDSPNWQ